MSEIAKKVADMVEKYGPIPETFMFADHID